MINYKAQMIRYRIDYQLQKAKFQHKIQTD